MVELGVTILTEFTTAKQSEHHRFILCVWSCGGWVGIESRKLETAQWEVGINGRRERVVDNIIWMQKREYQMWNYTARMVGKLKIGNQVHPKLVAKFIGNMGFLRLFKIK